MEKQTNALVPTYSNQNSMLMNNDRFEHAQRVAKLLASSDLVPTHFRGKMANCLIALNLADRMQLDPFMVMQKMYVVHGKPGIESQLAIAVFNKSGFYKPIGYEEGGEGKEKFCIAVSEDLRTKTVIKSTKVTLKMADAEGWSLPKGTMVSKWVTMPDVMLRYRSAMFLIKQYAPEVILGMHSKEEIIDIAPQDTKINVDFEVIKEPIVNEKPDKTTQPDSEKPDDHGELPLSESEKVALIGYSEDEPGEQVPAGIVNLQNEVIEKLNFMALNSVDSYNEPAIRQNTLKKILGVPNVRENDAKHDLERCAGYFDQIINGWKKRNPEKVVDDAA